MANLLTQSIWTLESHAAMATGELEWDLAQRTPHDAGATLDITVRIKNTTDAPRQYRVYFGLFDLSGPVVATWVYPDAFLILGMSEESFVLSLKVKASDCILQASLFDLETGSMGATLQTILEQSEAPIEGGVGSLSWSLLPKTSFAAGSNLSVTFKIRNPSPGERRYQIRYGLFDLGGGVIETGSFTAEVTVLAESERLVPVSVKVNYSNCILQASLYDVDTGGMSSALQTTLEQPPGIGGQMSAITGLAAGIMALGVVSLPLVGAIKSGS